MPKKFFYVLLDVIEVYIPAVMLLCLFTSFIAGIIFRYVFRNPQPWTFELSSISFLQLAILSACFVQRNDRHIVFDMIYSRASERTQCLMRIIGGIIICFTAAVLIPTSIKYSASMYGLKTQILKWPRSIVFVCFPVSFVIMEIRYLHKVIIDFMLLFNKNKI